jgi:hypothetical protein
MACSLYSFVVIIYHIGRIVFSQLVPTWRDRVHSCTRFYVNYVKTPTVNYVVKKYFLSKITNLIKINHQ